jgi:hypothetical protein
MYNLYICICICTIYVCVYMYTHTYTYTYMSVCGCACVCVCVCVCEYIYTDYTYKPRRSKRGFLSHFILDGQRNVLQRLIRNPVLFPQKIKIKKRRKCCGVREAAYSEGLRRNCTWRRMRFNKKKPRRV